MLSSGNTSYFRRWGRFLSLTTIQIWKGEHEKELVVVSLCVFFQSLPQPDYSLHHHPQNTLDWSFSKKRLSWPSGKKGPIAEKRGCDIDLFCCFLCDCVHHVHVCVPAYVKIRQGQCLMLSPSLYYLCFASTASELQGVSCNFPLVLGLQAYTNTPGFDMRSGDPNRSSCLSSQYIMHWTTLAPAPWIHFQSPFVAFI